MPTPTGLPKVGEVWQLQVRVLRDVGPRTRAVVLERTRGDYWGLRVAIPYGEGRFDRKMWVDAAYHHRLGELTYVGLAGPKTRKALGLPPLRKTRGGSDVRAQ